MSPGLNDGIYWMTSFDQPARLRIQSEQYRVGV